MTCSVTSDSRQETNNTQRDNGNGSAVVKDGATPKQLKTTPELIKTAGILRRADNRRESGSNQRRSVTFPDQQVQIIGYGGQEFLYSDDDEDDDRLIDASDKRPSDSDSDDDDSSDLNDQDRKVCFSLQNLSFRERKQQYDRNEKRDRTVEKERGRNNLFICHFN